MTRSLLSVCALALFCLPAAATESAMTAWALRQLSAAPVTPAATPELDAANAAVFMDGKQAPAGVPAAVTAGQQASGQPALPAAAAAPVQLSASEPGGSGGAPRGPRPPAPREKSFWNQDPGFSRAECFGSGYTIVGLIPAAAAMAIPVLGVFVAIALIVALAVPAAITGAVFAACRIYKGGL